jgi:hypothetical protein
MKAKKKPLGIKQKIREGRRREQRIALAAAAAILIATIFVSGFFINSMLNKPSTSQTVASTSQPKAAIVDHLSLTFPNQPFIETATKILTQVGYTVDYYSGEKITVEFYKSLPAHGYGIIMLRVHSTTTGGHVSLFTSEPYSTSKYVNEQLSGRVVPVAYSLEEWDSGIGYFGVTPLFVESDMIGKLSDTMIFAMGCKGLVNVEMGEALVEKGARAYVSWKGSVSADYTDQVTIDLLQCLLLEKQPLRQAVENTMKEVGPDPAYETSLGYYPFEAGDQTIENFNSKS